MCFGFCNQTDISKSKCNKGLLVAKLLYNMKYLYVKTLKVKREVIYLVRCSVDETTRDTNTFGFVIVINT